MSKEICVALGVDIDAVGGWLGSYGGEDSPADLSRGVFAGEVVTTTSAGPPWTRSPRTSSRAPRAAWGRLVTRPPLPPFTRETAVQKVRLAEDAWNTRDAEKVAGAYTADSRWRNRAEFVTGRAEIVAFLTRKWARELEYRLIKELWATRTGRSTRTA